jgi:hypothetical protein
VRVLAVGSDNGVDTDDALAAAECVDTAMDVVERFSESVRDLIKRD